MPSVKMDSKTISPMQIKSESTKGSKCQNHRLWLLSLGIPQTEIDDVSDGDLAAQYRTVHELNTSNVRLIES